MSKTYRQKPDRKRIGPDQQPEATPYEVLEIPQTASFEEIRKAYLKKVRSSPPEKDPEGFKAVRKAYGLLKDSEKRKAFDLSIFRKNSGIDTGLDCESDFIALFKDSIFRILFAASDLSIKDFSKDYKSIDEAIRRLK